MTKLSVNINKVATLRNSRGGDNPDLVRTALDIESFGAQGITVHPRPDERHIRFADVPVLKEAISTELNIEGYPSERFQELVLRVKPAQVTLVPDAPDQLTSNHGWDTKENSGLLTDLITMFHEAGIRTSIFIDADEEMAIAAAATGTDRVELYTEPYAAGYAADAAAAIAPFKRAAAVCREAGLGLNAGHDLSLENLAYFHRVIPFVDEVSIGHALICDALYLGYEETIARYLACLRG